LDPYHLLNLPLAFNVSASFITQAFLSINRLVPIHLAAYSSHPYIVAILRLLKIILDPNYLKISLHPIIIGHYHPFILKIIVSLLPFVFFELYFKLQILNFHLIS
jgi:hypothetical protein